MTVKTTRFDAADYLKTPEDVAEYLTAALETQDAEEIADALGVIARAHGMAEIADSTGLNRQNLYKALARGGNPELSTLLQVIAALGLKLEASPANEPHAA